MDYKLWSDLKSAMATEAFCIDAADVMITSDRAREMAASYKTDSDQNIDPASPRIQSWRNLEHQMGNALIALEQLGYEIKPKSKSPRG